MQKRISPKGAVKVFFIYFFILAIVALTLIPFLWMLVSSVKYNKDVFSLYGGFFPEEYAWSNYPNVFKRMPFMKYTFNSVKLTIIVTILQLVTSTFAAYGFAKLQFPGRNTLFLCYVCTIAVPWQTYMVPQYTLFRMLGIVNTHWAIIILQAFTAFGVFLIRQFYMGIPSELCEAARIDGLSEYGIYLKIMLPLSKPAVATLTIFTFTSVWNDFMGPMIYLHKDDLKTIQLGLRSLIGEYSSEYGLLMAGSVLALVPVFIVFLCLQRFFIEGIATSGLKG